MSILGAIAVAVPTFWVVQNAFISARVSTDGQCVDAQVKQLRATGAEKIFRETRSARAPTASLRIRLDRRTGGRFSTGLRSQRRRGPQLSELGPSLA
jgi:hypothetical protein